MTPNVGQPDKMVRIAAAIAAVVGALLVGATSTFGIVLWVVAVVMAVTAVTGFCPLYRVFGVNTRSAEHR